MNQEHMDHLINVESLRSNFESQTSQKNLQRVQDESVKRDEYGAREATLDLPEGKFHLTYGDIFTFTLPNGTETGFLKFIAVDKNFSDHSVLWVQEIFNITNERSPYYKYHFLGGLHQTSIKESYYTGVKKIASRNDQQPHDGASIVTDELNPAIRIGSKKASPSIGCQLQTKMTHVLCERAEVSLKYNDLFYGMKLIGRGSRAFGHDRLDFPYKTPLYRFLGTDKDKPGNVLIQLVHQTNGAFGMKILLGEIFSVDLDEILDRVTKIGVFDEKNIKKLSNPNNYDW